MMSGFDFVSGHFGYDFARHIMRDRYSIVFLRNPYERVLSMYYFCRNQPTENFEIYKIAKRLTILGFLEAASSDPWVRKNIYNNQVWQLAHGYQHLDERDIFSFSDSELLEMAEKNIEEFNAVGLTECFAEDANTIFERLRLPPFASWRFVNATPNRPIASAHSGKVRARLAKITELDWELYRHALELRHFAGGVELRAAR